MTFDELKRAIHAAPERPLTDFDRRPRGERAASVLLLMSDGADPEVVVERRASTLRRHAGQMALPGGRIDPGDEGPVAAALREAREEVGLDPSEVRVLGQLPPLWVPASNYDVTTVLATWPGGELGVVDESECESVHQYPISQLTDPEVFVTCRHPAGFTGPAFVLPDSFIWGLTAHLLTWTIDLAGWGRSTPGPRREVEIPAAYLQD